MGFLGFQGPLGNNLSMPTWVKFRGDVLVVALIYAWSMGTQIYVETTVIYIGSSILLYLSERMPLLDWYLGTVGGAINKSIRVMADAVTIVVISPVAVIYGIGLFTVGAIQLAQRNDLWFNCQSPLWYYNLVQWCDC